MFLKIHLINNALFSGEAERLTFKTPLGETTVLNTHEPLITLVDSGDVSVQTKEGEKKFSFPGGVLEVKSGSEVTLIAKHL